MKTIGLIGGMSWESTLQYYRLLNEGVRARLGGLSSAQVLLHSVDFAPIARMQSEGRWDDAGAELARVAALLARGGADFLVLAANTMHCVADRIEAAVTIPLLHIADAAGAAIRARGLGRVGLLGTRFTMEQPFYRERLRGRYGLDVIVPRDDERALVHRVIYEELCQGRMEATSRQAYRSIAAALVADGAEGVILGCTEIGMFFGSDEVTVPLFDTTVLHAAAAVERALAD
jgi:aspartate racemase